MIDLLDVTFMIPTRIESEDRKNNLTIVVDYLIKHFNTNIIICEQDSTEKVTSFFKPNWKPNCKHVFLKSDSTLFHKTRCLNVMTKMSTTPIVVSFDSDILFPINQLVESRDIIKNKTDFFVYPFNTRLYHIEKPLIPTIKRTLDLNSIGSHTTCRHLGLPPGGAFFMDKAMFYQCGLENENFLSWGPEDQERAYRVKKLGFNIRNVEGPIFHLDHERTPNSNHQHSQYERNQSEFKKIQSYSVQQLRNYIGTWPWTR